MTIKTNCTNRKEMVKRISEHLGVESKYLFAPTCAYQIGSFIVNRDGSIDCPDELAAQNADLMVFLSEAGYVDEKVEEADHGDVDLKANAEEEGGEEIKTLDELEEALNLEAIEDDKPAAVDAIIHNHGLDAQGMIRLMRMVYSRQHLIRKMTQTVDILLDEEMITRMREEHAATTEDVLRIFNDCVRLEMAKGITLTAEDFGFSFTYDDEHPAHWQFGSILMNAMVDKCKEVQRINAKLQEPADDEMKYFARAWLVQLGLGGAEYADFRHAMLDHLKGYAAFRTAAEMEAHNAKYAAKRKQGNEASTADLKAHDEMPSENGEEEADVE